MFSKSSVSLVCLANCVFHEFYRGLLRTLLWRINDDDDDDDDVSAETVII